MNESTGPMIPLLIVAIVGMLIAYLRSLENKKRRKPNYRQLTPNEILHKNNYSQKMEKHRTSHLDIQKFVARHTK